MGCKNNVEVHHIRKLVRRWKGGISVKSAQFEKKLTDFFGAVDLALNRKQVPLCQKHHDLRHEGELDIISSLELFFVNETSAEPRD